MCTRIPNWQEIDLNKNDSGFVKTIFMTSGEQYYDYKENKYKTIKFTNVYFNTFIKDTKPNKQIIL